MAGACGAASPDLAIGWPCRARLAAITTASMDEPPDLAATASSLNLTMKRSNCWPESRPALMTSPAWAAVPAKAMAVASASARRRCLREVVVTRYFP